MQHNKDILGENIYIRRYFDIYLRDLLSRNRSQEVQNNILSRLNIFIYCFFIYFIFNFIHSEKIFVRHKKKALRIAVKYVLKNHA